MKTLVQARALSKSFGPRMGLRPLDLDVAGGELVGLVGPSGSGKTTLIRLLYGALRPTAGTLRVLNRDLTATPATQLRELRRRIAVVPQAHGLIPSLSAAQNVAAGLAGRSTAWDSLRALAWLSRSERAAAHTALSSVGIADLMEERVDRLSGGQQQRVAVARALVQGADLLLADEPVASVDGETARQLLGVLADLAASGGSVLVSLHQKALAADFCHRLVRLPPSALAAAS